MDDTPRPSPDDTPAASAPAEPHPLLDGLDARRLVADILDESAIGGFDPTWQAPTPEELGGMLLGYEVHGMLGRGGMGAVYLATETRIGRRVAIKLLPPELGLRHNFRQRFEREAWTLAQLDHPHIVRLHGLGESEGGHLYLVMEYVEGSSVSDLIRDSRANAEPGRPVLPWPRIVEIIGQLCEALGHAHSRGLIHRDLKPANVLLTADGSVKLVDFGLARPLVKAPPENAGGSLMTRTGEMMGTYDYMAPELRDGLQGDHRVDLYGVGVLLYQMLTGSIPRGAFAPPSALAGTSLAIDRLVLAAMATDPAQRPVDAAAMREALLACPPQGIDLPRRGWRRLAGVGVLAACSLVGTFWLISNRRAASLAASDGRMQRGEGIAAPPAPGGSVAAPVERRTVRGLRVRRLDTVPGVWIAEIPTTVGEYRKFARATNRPPAPAQFASRVGDPMAATVTWENPGRQVADSESVVGVAAADVRDFCHWLTREARRAGEIEPGQEFRLPSAAEWREAMDLAPRDARDLAGVSLDEEWLNDPFSFTRPWLAVQPVGGGGTRRPPVTAQNNSGHTRRGFRVVLDLKTPELRGLSERAWEAAKSLGALGAAAADRPSVDVLVRPGVVRVDLTRRPDITSLEPLRGLGITEFRAAPESPLDLSPLGGQPVSVVTLFGPVVSLNPLAASPVTHLSTGAFSLLPRPPSGPGPSLQPLLKARRLTHLGWRGYKGGPDVPLREFPKLDHVSIWDCELESLSFFTSAGLLELVINRTSADLLTGRDPLRQVLEFERSEPMFAEADALALTGDLTGALRILDTWVNTLSGERWFDPVWRGTLDRRKFLWTEWQTLGLEPWMRDGARGPAPGSRAWRDHDYLFLPTPMTRTEAEFWAATCGGRLATLADPEERAFVAGSVLPDTAQPAVAQLGAWPANEPGRWQWVTGEPWEDATTTHDSADSPQGRLVLEGGPNPRLSDSPRPSMLPVVIEWGGARESSRLLDLESRLIGRWVADDGFAFELMPRGQVGPNPSPGDRWFVVDAAAGRALVSRYHGKIPFVIARSSEGEIGTLTRPDGTTITVRRHR